LDDAADGLAGVGLGVEPCDDGLDGERGIRTAIDHSGLVNRAARGGDVLGRTYCAAAFCCIMVGCRRVNGGNGCDAGFGW